ncbi:hypothetical protein AB0L06_19965 [Spirillospora sp. NPDC052269]
MALPQPLLEYIGPPIAPPVPPDWDLVSGSLGTGLPDDYMELSETYPMLKLDDWLLITHPSVPEPGPGFYDLSSLEQRALSQSRFLIQDHIDELHVYDPATGTTDERRLTSGKLPYPAYPEPGGLMSLGMSEENHQWCWLTEGHPDAWTMMIIDSPMAWHYLGGLTHLLSDLITGRVNCPVVAPDFGQHGHRTVQYL